MRILRAEKATRKCAFADQPDVLVYKVGEIERVLETLERWQEELKVHLYK